jgi:hypothetical protein
LLSYKAVRMYKNILFFISLILLSCTDPEKIVVPEHLLQEEKMAAVIKDLTILEASMNVHVASVDPGKNDKQDLKMNIYARNGITKEQFEESYRFYTENPEKMNEVYQLVLNDLSTMQATVVNKK